MSTRAQHRLAGWLAFLGALWLLRGAFTIVYLTLIFGWTTAVLHARFPARFREPGLARALVLSLLHVTVIGSACLLAAGAVAYLGHQGAAAFDSTKRGDPETALREALHRALAGFDLYRTYGASWATSPAYRKERDELWDAEIAGGRADCLKDGASARAQAAQLHADFTAWLVGKLGGEAAEKEQPPPSGLWKIVPSRLRRAQLDPATVERRGLEAEQALTPAAREAYWAEWLRGQQGLIARPCAPPTLARALEIEQAKDDAAFERVKDRWFLEQKALRMASTGAATGPLTQLLDVVSKSIPMVAGWLGSIVSGLLGMGLDVVCSIVFSFLVLCALPDMAASARDLEGTAAGEVWGAMREDLARLGEALFNGFVALVIIGALNGVVAGVLLKMCGVEGAAYLGSIVLMCSLIPILGKVIAALPLCLVAFGQGGSDAALKALAVLVIAHVLENVLWNPFVLSRFLRLKPLTVTLVQIPGQIVFGLWGLLLAPPVADFLWEMATRREAT